MMDLFTDTKPQDQPTTTTHTSKIATMAARNAIQQSHPPLSKNERQLLMMEQAANTDLLIPSPPKSYSAGTSSEYDSNFRIDDTESEIMRTVSVSPTPNKQWTQQPMGGFMMDSGPSNDDDSHVNKIGRHDFADDRSLMEQAANTNTDLFRSDLYDSNFRINDDESEIMRLDTEGLSLSGGGLRLEVSNAKRPQTKAQLQAALQAHFPLFDYDDYDDDDYDDDYDYEPDHNPQHGRY
eukprot:CAMPEP_0194447726 /NCGR_PEP_ID=MMETSP0176-20130528/129172_1 /TAXON_ID=216777 /ORGANISM="Proboscia alata, Strain PI-D3" /LENGTH=236 /DNA_ID=CAMNT_0039274621 /DNA_START=43 /DNA_END=749 /DNA_ORIENTATION=+